MTALSRVLFGVALLTSKISIAQLDDQESPSSSGNQPYEWCTTCSGSVWDNTSSVFADDGQNSAVHLQQYLNCFQSSCYWSRYMETYNYGFNIPLNAVIEGIQVTVKSNASANGSVKDSTIRLRRNNIQLNGTEHARNDPWSVNAELRTYGDASDLWGENWTPSDINSPDFGTYLKVYNQASQARDAYIDHISITITYAISTQVYTVTESPSSWTVYHDNISQLLFMNFEETNFSDNAELMVVDMNGKVIFDKKGAAINGEESFSTASLAAGVYTCMLVNGKNVESKKFMVIHQ